MNNKNINSKKSSETAKTETASNSKSATKTNNKTSKQKSESIKDKIFMTHLWWVDALIFIGGTLILGGIATLLGGKMFNFQNYKMPPGTAPKIVFPIVWAIIYVAIGVSTFLMWRDKEVKEKDRKVNLILYFIHMFFNIMWPLFFFRLNLPVFACVWLLLTVISALVVTFRYFYANIASGIIFCIYNVWLIYALYLNLGLCLLNLI